MHALFQLCAQGTPLRHHEIATAPPKSFFPPHLPWSPLLSSYRRRNQRCALVATKNKLKQEGKGSIDAARDNYRMENPHEMVFKAPPVAAGSQSREVGGEILDEGSDDAADETERGTVLSTDSISFHRRENQRGIRRCVRGRGSHAVVVYSSIVFSVCRSFEYGEYLAVFFGLKNGRRRTGRFFSHPRERAQGRSGTRSQRRRSERMKIGVGAGWQRHLNPDQQRTACFWDSWAPPVVAFDRRCHPVLRPTLEPRGRSFWGHVHPGCYGGPLRRA